MPPLWDVLPGGEWLHSVASPCTFPGPHVLAGPGACYLSPGGAHCLTQTLLPNATSQVSGLAHPNTWGSSEVLNVDSWHLARRSCRLMGWRAIQCYRSHVHESPVWAREQMTVLAPTPSRGGSHQVTQQWPESRALWRLPSPDTDRCPHTAAPQPLPSCFWLTVLESGHQGQVGFSLAAMARKGRGGRRSRDKSPVYVFLGKVLTCYSAVRVWSMWCVKCA